MKKLLLITVLALLGATIPAKAQTVSRTNVPPSITLTWNAITGAASYNAYFGGASQTYTNVTPVLGTNSITLTNVAAGSTYFLTVTAVGTNGLESPYSNEQTTTVPTPPPAPVLNTPTAK
jgi:fibronectin type 3 domain-containing protein